MRNRRAHRIQIVTACCIAALAIAGPARAQSQSDIEALRKEIESLKAGQAALQKQIQEIRDMLRSREPQAVSDAPPNATIETSGAPTRGSSAATVVMIEFSDYQCPYCARYQRDSWPSIEREYVQTGKLRYVFRAFPLESIHKQAFKAHEAAACAGAQGQYWPMHAQLFAHQSALAPQDLKKYAQAIGLDTAAFGDCLDSGKMTGSVRHDADLGEVIGIQGTPLFLVGTPKADGTVLVRKVISGAQPFEVIKRAIEEVLSAK